MSDKKAQVSVNMPSTEQMVKAGLHFGHRKSKKNPHMDKYVSGLRNDIQIFDIDIVSDRLEAALKALAEMAARGETIMFVGSKVGKREIVREAAQSCGMPYVDSRWLGGTLTNFKTILKRMEKLLDWGKKLAEGGFDHYTKREKLKIKEQLAKMEVKFGGFKNLKKAPNALFILSLKDDTIAAREARATGVKVIAVVDTNADPELVDLIIPANDDALSSVSLIVKAAAETIKKAKLLSDGPETPLNK